MTTIDVLVKKAPSRNQVSQREPPAAPPDPYAAGCPTRLLLDRIGDKWMVLTLGLIRDKPRRFNALDAGFGPICDHAARPDARGGSRRAPALGARSHRRRARRPAAL